MKRDGNKYPNLIPNSERSPEELREMGRKGGIKSGESRRKKRNLQKMMKLCFEAIDNMSEEDRVKLHQVCNKRIKNLLK